MTQQRSIIIVGYEPGTDPSAFIHFYFWGEGGGGERNIEIGEIETSGCGWWFLPFNVLLGGGGESTTTV